MTRIALQPTPARAWYMWYLAHSWRWRVLRRVAMRLSGGRCRLCGARAVEVHHRDYAHCGRGGVVGAVRELLDLTPLCGACHGRYHDA